MTSGAHVGSIEAIREFLAALHTFAAEARNAIDSFDLEVQASLDAVREVEPARLQHELRKSDELISRAKIELEKARVTKLPGGEPKSCIEERKQLERARLRRQYVEEKIESLRKWSHIIQHHSDEYFAKETQLNTLFDAEFPRAIQLLNRVLDTLAAYTSFNSRSMDAASAPSASIEFAAEPANDGDAVTRPDYPPPDSQHTTST